MQTDIPAKNWSEESLFSDKSRSSPSRAMCVIRIATPEITCSHERYHGLLKIPRGGGFCTTISIFLTVRTSTFAKQSAIL